MIPFYFCTGALLFHYLCIRVIQLDLVYHQSSTLTLNIK